MNSRWAAGEQSGSPRSLRPAPAAPARACWLALPASLGAEASLAYFSRTLGAIVTLTEVAGTTVIVLVLLGVVLFGSKDTCERAFRLMRWAANRPEPPPLLEIQATETTTRHPSAHACRESPGP